MCSHMLSTFLLLCFKLKYCLFLCSYFLLLILRSKVRKGAYLPFPDFCGLGDVMLEVTGLNQAETFSFCRTFCLLYGLRNNLFRVFVFVGSH